MENVKVLYISYNSIDDPLLISQGLSYIEALTHKYSFTLLTFEREYKQDFYSRKRKLKEKNIDWIYYKINNNSIFFFKIINYVLNSLRIAKILITEEFSILHIRGYASMFTFIFSYFLFRILFLFKNSPKIIFDLRNPTIDEIVDTNYLFIFIRFFLQKLEKIMFKMSSAIIVVSDEYKKFIFNKFRIYGIDNKKIFVVYNNVNLEKFIFFDNFNNHKDSFKLVYIGIIDKYHPLEPMLNFFELLIKEFPYAEFYICTYSEESKLFAEKFIFEKYNYLAKKIKILKLFYDEIPQILSMCNLGIYFFLGNNIRGKISYPIKIGEYLAAGLPIICNRSIGISDIIVKENCGVVVEDLDKESFIKAIDNLKDLLKDKDIKRRCRNFAESYFSLKKSVENLEECYKWVLEN